MKKLIQICMLGILMLSIMQFRTAAQEHKETKKAPPKTSAMHHTSQGAMPYEATYSSKFVMGDPKFARMIMDLWKDWDNNTLNKNAHLFADTVTMYFSDGTMAKGKDSVMAGAQQYRDKMAEVKSTVHAWMSTHSTDKNENWVTIWGTEEDTWKDGKKTTTAFNEVWRFNKAGKVDLMRQFEAKAPPMK
ncbi:MAG TPA: nuclear transport factor 2 family protein [Daejeonella sp.]|nr:nuclear transport factor 2 family protein [Daejeonella sp.]